MRARRVSAVDGAVASAASAATCAGGSDDAAAVDGVGVGVVAGGGGVVDAAAFFLSLSFLLSLSVLVVLSLLAFVCFCCRALPAFFSDCLWFFQFCSCCSLLVTKPRKAREKKREEDK